MRCARLPRILVALLVGAAWLFVCPADARANSVPPPYFSVDDGWHGPVNLEWQQLTGVLRAIATDIDRDGDLDVIGTTVDQPLVVWINDGTGHLTRQRPGPAPSLVTRDTDAARPLSGRDLPGATLSCATSPLISRSRERAPPAGLCGVVVDLDHLFLTAEARSSRDSRGPPLTASSH